MVEEVSDEGAAVAVEIGTTLWFDNKVGIDDGNSDGNAVGARDGSSDGDNVAVPEKVGVRVGESEGAVELACRKVVVCTHCVHEPDLRPFSAIQPK